EIETSRPHTASPQTAVASLQRTTQPIPRQSGKLQTEHSPNPPAPSPDTPCRSSSSPSKDKPPAARTSTHTNPDARRYTHAPARPCDPYTPARPCHTPLVPRHYAADESGRS